MADTAPDRTDTILALAPLAGLTHAAFRMLVHEYGGCDIYFSEMTSADAVNAGGSYEQYYLSTLPRPESFILQLVSGTSESITTAVKNLSSLPLLGFDINMGCAAPKIVRKGGGYAWMAKPDEAEALISGVKRAAGTKQVSAKIRIGDSPDPEAFLAFARRLVLAGLDLLTVHPRTGKQSFNRPGFPDFIGLAAESLPIPVYGNGDVRSYAEYRNMVETQRPAGIMIGREAIRSPWIFHCLREIESLREAHLQFDRSECALRFVALLAAHQPPDFHISRAKLFFAYFVKHFRFGHDLGKRINRCTSAGAMAEQVCEYVERNPDERFSKVRAVSRVG